MTAPVDVLADLRLLANVGEYRELREAMEACLRPHERNGFAELLARMGANAAAVAELLVRADNASTLLSNMIAARKVDERYGDIVTDLTAALARVQGGGA